MVVIDYYNLRIYFVVMRILVNRLTTTMAVRYSSEHIANAAIYAANELCGEKLVTPMGTIWYHTKQMKESHLKSIYC